MVLFNLDYLALIIAYIVDIFQANNNLSWTIVPPSALKYIQLITKRRRNIVFSTGLCYVAGQVEKPVHTAVPLHKVLDRLAGER